MLGFPYMELLNRIPAKGLVLPKDLTQDICAGIVYAFSTLQEDEQQVLLLRCKDKAEYGAIAKQMHLTEELVVRLEKEAIRKLCLQGRRDYICHGVKGYLRMRLSRERAKAYREGFMDAYFRGGGHGPGNVPDMPVEMLGLSAYGLNCLMRAGIRTVGETAEISEEDLRRMRNLGPKTAAEIAAALRKQGVIYTIWDKFYMEEK